MPDLPVTDEGAKQLLQWCLRMSRELREYVESLLDADALEEAREVYDDGCLFCNQCDTCKSVAGSPHHPDCPHYVRNLMDRARSDGVTTVKLNELKAKLAEYAGDGDPIAKARQETEYTRQQLEEMRHVVVVQAAELRKHAAVKPKAEPPKTEDMVMDYNALHLPWYEDPDGMIVGTYMEVIAGLGMDENDVSIPAIYRQQMRDFIILACNTFHAKAERLRKIEKEFDDIKTDQSQAWDAADRLKEQIRKNPETITAKGTLEQLDLICCLTARIDPERKSEKTDAAKG